jgi:hypothetical protein
MGFWEILEEAAFPVGYAVKTQLQKRREAMHRAQSGGLREDVEALISRMDDLDTVLQGAEFAGKAEYAEKIADLRSKLGEVKDIISKPLDYYDALSEIWTFVEDVKATGKFTPGQDPLGEAKAYGKALKSLGKVAGRIPLLNVYSSFLEEMGDRFAQTVANIVPHLRDNTPTRDGLFRQSEGRSMYE